MAPNLPTATPQAAPAAPPVEQPAGRDPDVEENKDLAALSYVWVFSILLYLSKRKSRFVRFHAKQGTILFLLSIAFWFIPYLGKFLELLVLFAAGWGFLHAAQGKWEEVPFIGPLSQGKLAVRSSIKKAVEGVVRGVGAAKQIWKETEKKENKPPPSPSPSAKEPTL